MNKSMALKQELEELTVETIREKGKNMGFSYTQSLSVYLFEKILFWVSQSELAEEMWQKPVDFYKKGQRRKTAPNQIVYYMKELSYQRLQQSMERMFQNKSSSLLQLNWEMLIYDKQMEVILNIKVEHVAVVFKIIIRPVWEKEQFPEQGTYQMLFWKEKQVAYKIYPAELNLAECFYEVLDHLELIGTMQTYGTIFQILATRPLDGRRMYLNMKEILEKQRLSSVEKRWSTVLAYADYTYMKKRWNKYVKEQVEAYGSWEECIQRMGQFFTPVWDAIQEDNIFFGDWMPDLGRYL